MIINKSNIFHPYLKYFDPNAVILMIASSMNIIVNIILRYSNTRSTLDGSSYHLIASTTVLINILDWINNSNILF